MEWSEDDTEVKFRMKKSYQYRADLSSGSLSDRVTLPNVPMFVGFLLTPTSISLSVLQGMYSRLRNTGPDVLKSGNLFLKTSQPDQKVFETKTVRLSELVSGPLANIGVAG